MAEFIPLVVPILGAIDKITERSQENERELAKLQHEAEKDRAKHQADTQKTYMENLRLMQTENEKRAREDRESHDKHMMEMRQVAADKEKRLDDDKTNLRRDYMDKEREMTSASRDERAQMREQFNGQLKALNEETIEDILRKNVALMGQQAQLTVQLCVAKVNEKGRKSNPLLVFDDATLAGYLSTFRSNHNNLSELHAIAYREITPLVAGGIDDTSFGKAQATLQCLGVQLSNVGRARTDVINCLSQPSSYSAEDKKAIHTALISVSRAVMNYQAVSGKLLAKVTNKQMMSDSDVDSFHQTHTAMSQSVDSVPALQASVFCDFCKQLKAQSARVTSVRPTYGDHKMNDDDCKCDEMQPGLYDIETEMCTPEIDDAREYIPPELQNNILERRPISMFITVYLMDMEQRGGRESYLSAFGRAILQRRMAQSTVACFLLRIDVKLALPGFPG